MADLYHVISLTDRQKAVTRWMIGYYVNIKISSVLAKLEGIAMDREDLIKLARTIIGLRRVADNLYNGWPILGQDQLKPETTFMQIRPEGMQIFMLAIKCYDAETVEKITDDNEWPVIKNEITKLIELVSVSNEFTYTKEEINLEIKRGNK